MASFFYTSDAGSLRRTWVPLVIWGTLIAVFGIVVAGMPELTTTVLVGLVGAVAVAAGLVWVSWAISLRTASAGWWTISLVPGALLLAFGAFTLLRPDAVASFLFQAAAVVAVIWGLADMAVSWRLRAFFSAWWLRLVRGLLVVGAAVVVFGLPVAGKVAAGLLVGVWFLVIGATTIALGLAARRLPNVKAAVVTDDRPAGGPLLPPA